MFSRRSSSLRRSAFFATSHPVNTSRGKRKLPPKRPLKEAIEHQKFSSVNLLTRRSLFAGLFSFIQVVLLRYWELVRWFSSFCYNFECTPNLVHGIRPIQLQTRIVSFRYSPLRLDWWLRRILLLFSYLLLLLFFFVVLERGSSDEAWWRRTAEKCDRFFAKENKGMSFGAC